MFFFALLWKQYLLLFTAGSLSRPLPDGAIWCGCSQWHSPMSVCTIIFRLAALDLGAAGLLFLSCICYFLHISFNERVRHYSTVLKACLEFSVYLWSATEHWLKMVALASMWRCFYWRKTLYTNVCFLVGVFSSCLFGLRMGLAPVSPHAACEGKSNTHPLLSFLLPFSSSLCSAIHTSNYRVCDGYYNTDLPGYG